MTITDTVTMKGLFDLHIFKNGVEIEHYVDHNMIMTAAREALAKLVGEGSTGKVINTIGIGTNGDGPDPSDTGLTGAYTKNISGVTYPESGKVTFSFSFTTAEGNGLNIQEFGLFCSDGILFARKTRGVIAKSDDISISGTWTIIF